MPAPLTLEGFRADLAEFLYQRPDEVDLEENPMDAGLDSCGSSPSSNGGGRPARR